MKISKLTKTYDADGKITTYDKAARGIRPTVRILRYKARLGNAKFIITGKMPQCSFCGGENMVSCVEIEQHKLFGGTMHDLVCQCGDCGQHTLYKYELE